MLDAADAFDVLEARPAWMLDGLCRFDPWPEAWFADVIAEPDAISHAKAVCLHCPVQAECLDYAMAQPSTWDSGVWGGTTPRDRLRIRQAWRKSANT